jgi:hypothetical protein
MLNHKNMKKIILNASGIITILLALLVSCDKNKNDNTDPAEKVKKLLELEARMNAINYGTDKMTNFMSVIGYSQYKDGELEISGSGSEPGYSDTTCCDTTDYWVPITCAIVTESDNEDGTHTTVFDYGDGCDEYGSLFKGKISYIWKNDNNNYYSEVIYDHYYAYGVEMNGVSVYSFTSDGNSYYSAGRGEVYNDSTVTIMPVEFNWSGTSTGHDEITMVYDDGNRTFYRSDYSNIWDSLSYKVLQGEYYYKSQSDNYEYHFLVTEPLITDYSCTNSWVPVSGVENITTTENGETEEYSLDYGDGTCDNLAELTQNGETSVIDFGELYKIMEPDGGSVSPANGRKGSK